MKTYLRKSVSPSLVLLMLVAAPGLRACPFCRAPTRTLSEQTEEADVVLAARWLSTQGRNDAQSRGSTTFEVMDAIRGDSHFKLRQRITLDGYRQGREGDLFLLFGSKERQIAWTDPLPTTRDAINYVHHIPRGEVPAETRLLFFFKYLDSPDKTVAEDAHSEFAIADYSDVLKIRTHLSRERLRAWLTDPKTEPERIGFYGMLLGLCGTPDDAKFLEKIIIRNEGDELRVGIDGLMGGYLLLTGDAGVDFLERTKLKPPDCPFTETFAAIQALRFAWTYAEDVVSRGRLKTAMRSALHREDMADLIIADLSRWKDWESLPLIVSLYDNDRFKQTAVKRTIIRFVNACSCDVPKSPAAPVPPHVTVARQTLEELRKRDPRLVADALRFYLKPSRQDQAKAADPAK